MKVTLVVLSFACFIGALHALPIDEEPQNFELEPQDFELEPQNFELEPEDFELEPQTFPNFEDEARPLVPRPVRPPQVHHNAVRSQGPFSGRLVNVVANKQGAQKTVQRNRIEYNINSIRKALDELLEDADNE